MIRSQPPPLPGDALIDPVVADAIELVRPDSLAVMLYGSRARGTARSDSDIDILAIVDHCPGAVNHGKISINYYTPSGINVLAKHGSLFVLHLGTEGIILADDHGYLQSALAAYIERSDYTELRGDLAVILNALSVRDRYTYYTGLRRAGVWAARSAVYLACAEEGRATFDMTMACHIAGVPRLAQLVQTDATTCLDSIGRLGLQALGVSAAGAHVDLATLAVRSWNSHPMGARLIESIISGQSLLEYTDLTLPIV